MNIDLKLKTYEQLQDEVIKLLTNDYLKDEKIKQLQSNWNNLREWLEDLYNKGYDIKIVLDKMNELESGEK